jgi:hypothetical protein
MGPDLPLTKFYIYITLEKNIYLGCFASFWGTYSIYQLYPRTLSASVFGLNPDPRQWFWTKTGIYVPPYSFPRIRGYGLWSASKCYGSGTLLTYGYIHLIVWYWGIPPISSSGHRATRMLYSALVCEFFFFFFSHFYQCCKSAVSCLSACENWRLRNSQGP